MRCSCCGNEVREDERYCNKCGQNNEGYVEKKPIERVEIYRQQSNTTPYNQSQATYQQPNNSPYNHSQPTYQQINNYQQSTYQPVKQESGALGILAIIFSVLGGWLGLILSIIGLCTYKTPEHRTKCKIGLGFVIGWFVLGFLVGLVGTL